MSRGDSLAQLRGQSQVTLALLALLLGRTCSGGYPAGRHCARGRSLAVPTIAPGTPASLLRRRPDIAVAEAQLHAATAKIGVQTAGLFPDVSLTRIVELLTGNLSKLILTDSIQAVEQGQVSFPILDFGRSKTLVGQAKASADESYLTCQRTVLVAMNDTETALSQVATARRARDPTSRIARQRPAWCRQRRRCAWPLFPCSRRWAYRHAIWADGEYANRSPLTSALRLIVTRPDGKEPVIDVI